MYTVAEAAAEATNDNKIFVLSVFLINNAVSRASTAAIATFINSLYIEKNLKSDIYFFAERLRITTVKSTDMLVASDIPSIPIYRASIKLSKALTTTAAIFASIGIFVS